MERSLLVLAAACALSVAMAGAQSSQNQTLTGTLTVRTRGASTAVLGKSSDGKGDFMFCIDQDRSAPRAVEVRGAGRVVYQPMPMPPMPAGVAVSGPEMVAPTLAVISDDGKAWVFVGKGQKPVLAADAPALAKATVVNVTMVRRTDWAAQNGPRRGVDMEGCLAPGG